MKKTCQECGIELSFRTQRWYHDRYLCPNCLDRIDPARTPASPSTSAVYSKGLVIAPLGARFGGQVIDWLVMVVIIYIGFSVSAVISPNLAKDDSEPFAVLGVILGFAYYLIADGLPGGQSLGKRLAGTKVVHATSGEPCNVGQSIGRNLLGVLGIFDWLFIFGDMHQRLGDKAANTIVVWK